MMAWARDKDIIRGSMVALDHIPFICHRNEVFAFLLRRFWSSDKGSDGQRSASREENDESIIWTGNEILYGLQWESLFWP